MNYELWYYAYYEQYVLTATVATTEALDEQYNEAVKTTSLINMNDEEYTVAEYGYIYTDNESKPTMSLYFQILDGNFVVDIYREDGLYGTADVSNVDTGWYVDYLRFYGFEKSEAFPGDKINSFLDVNVDIPAPVADFFVYGGVEAGIDDYGDYNPDTYYVFTDGDVATAYGETLKENTNFVVTETTDMWGYAVYEARDKGNNIVISFEEGYDNTQIIFKRFADVYTTEKTTRTDWADEEKALMNECLGEVLPFIALGEDYVVESDDFLGFYWVSITDTYYKNLLGNYGELLVANGFTESNGSYVKDNRTAYLEVELDYDGGNSITVYYEESHYVPATKVELAFDEVDVVPGYSGLELNPVLTPKDASSVVTYTSSSEYATITEAGVVSISESCPVDTVITITATAEEGVTDTCVINVKENKVTSGILNCTSLELAPGESFKIEVKQLLPLGVTAEYTCGWGQTPSSFIHIDGFGNVTVDNDAEIGSTATVYAQFYPGEGQKVYVTVTVVEATVTDKLTQTSFGLKDGNSTYAEHDSVGAGGTYHAQCASQHGVQIRSKNSNSGIIGHYEGKKTHSISVTFNTNTYVEGKDRILDIYASDEAFTIADMYSGDMTPVGSLSYDSDELTKTYTFTKQYTYVGVRSHDGAIFMDSISFSWK